MGDPGAIFALTKAVLAIVFSYLIGSIPVGLIVARIAGGIDIREHGSGNIGLTNVIRTLGWGPGLITGLLDFLKGYLPVLFAMASFTPQAFGLASISDTIVIIVAACVVLGNLYPVYLLFRGGKGVATALGVLSALMGVYIFIPLAIFGLFLFLFRFVSLGSIMAAISVPLTILLLSKKVPFVARTPDSSSAMGILMAFAWITAILIVWRHRSNIGRIFAGTEPRVRRPREPRLAAVPEKSGQAMKPPEMSEPDSQDLSETNKDT